MPLEGIKLTDAQQKFMEALEIEKPDNSSGVYVWRVGSVVTAKRLAEKGLIVFTPIDPHWREAQCWGRVRKL